LQWKMLVFYSHCVYFTAKWYILWPYSSFCGHLVYFRRFGKLYREKSGNRVLNSTSKFICWNFSRWRGKNVSAQPRKVFRVAGLLCIKNYI
jgi:hypothetical protein